MRRFYSHWFKHRYYSVKYLLGNRIVSNHVYKLTGFVISINQIKSLVIRYVARSGSGALLPQAKSFTLHLGKFSKATRGMESKFCLILPSPMWICPLKHFTRATTLLIIIWELFSTPPTISNITRNLRPRN